MTGDRRSLMLSRRGLLGGALACGAGVLAGCSSGLSIAVSKEEESVSFSTFLFDTVVQIDAACDEELLSLVRERLEFFESKFSRTVEGSDVWNINNAAGAPVEVSAETADVIARALAFSAESGGLFDVTIGAVSALWDFTEETRPADVDIAEAVRHIDYRGVTVEGTTVTLADPEARLDLGGIAKGYIADSVAAMLAEGCSDAFINLGGNVYAMGKSFDGDAWVVGVQDPNGARDEGVAKLECSDMSVVTSGLYERSFEQDGVLYHHILDPRTGYPAETDLVSASIACESSTTADAYSTILFLKGHDAALALLEDDDRFQGGVLIDDAGNVTVSEGSGFELL